jgi:hypothetical protein
MGMFDTIHLPCPCCEKKVPVQAKSGLCALVEYELEEAPVDVLVAVVGREPFKCESCGTSFIVDVKVKASTVAVASNRVSPTRQPREHRYSRKERIYRARNTCP